MSSSDSPSQDNARAGRTTSGAALALVPLAVFVLLLAMMLPRATPPSDVPLPEVNQKKLGAIFADDDRRYARFVREGLPADVRALGTELRAFHKQQARGDALVQLEQAKDRVESARALAIATAGKELVRVLFVVQQRAFLERVTVYEHTAAPKGTKTEDDTADETEDPELAELGGSFLARLRQAGWVVGREVLPDETERRVLYKMMWALDVGLENDEAFALSLDERRVVYRLYLRLPHPPEHLRATLADARRQSDTPERCRKIADEERAAAEKWRIGKIALLGELDSSYPTDYALGIAHYRLGDYQASAGSFRRWLDQHPDGAYTLRAQNFLKAATKAAEELP
jgi:TolA-binding protein